MRQRLRQRWRPRRLRDSVSPRRLARLAGRGPAAEPHRPPAPPSAEEPIQPASFPKSTWHSCPLAPRHTQMLLLEQPSSVPPRRRARRAPAPSRCAARGCRASLSFEATAAVFFTTAANGGPRGVAAGRSPPSALRLGSAFDVYAHVPIDVPLQQALGLCECGCGERVLPPAPPPLWAPAEPRELQGRPVQPKVQQCVHDVATATSADLGLQSCSLLGLPKLPAREVGAGMDMPCDAGMLSDLPCQLPGNSTTSDSNNNYADEGKSFMLLLDELNQEQPVQDCMAPLLSMQLPATPLWNSAPQDFSSMPGDAGPNTCPSILLVPVLSQSSELSYAGQQAAYRVPLM
eukprot:351362-Chlamydomonas_euryale.AAC.9